MRRLALVLLLTTASQPAHADMLAPVKAVMETAKALWSENPPEDAQYFSKAQLETLYSDQFVQAFAAASKNPPFGLEEGETEGYPFDYDVVTYSQDGCPLEDLKLAEPVQSKAGSLVKVTFRLWGCSEDATEKATINEVHFVVIEEGGRPVIADIKRIFEGEELSLIEEMQDIAKGTPPQ
jgi:hypothetical protein